jgi:hypothetical protein
MMATRVAIIGAVKKAGQRMTVLFVSHSSKDDAAASTLENWLRGRGFTDIFR